MTCVKGAKPLWALSPLSLEQQTLLRPPHWVVGKAVETLDNVSCGGRRSRRAGFTNEEMRQGRFRAWSPVVPRDGQNFRGAAGKRAGGGHTRAQHVMSEK